MVRQALQRFGHLRQMEGGFARRDLVHERVGETLARDDRQAGNIVDRLFRIEFGALAAGAIKHVHDMRLQVQEAEFEDGEEPYWPGADDDDVGLVMLARLGRDGLDVWRR